MKHNIQAKPNPQRTLTIPTAFIAIWREVFSITQSAGPRPCRTGGRCCRSRPWCSPPLSGRRWSTPARRGSPVLRQTIISIWRLGNLIYSCFINLFQTTLRNTISRPDKLFCQIKRLRTLNRIIEGKFEEETLDPKDIRALN